MRCPERDLGGDAPGFWICLHLEQDECCGHSAARFFVCAVLDLEPVELNPTFWHHALAAFRPGLNDGIQIYYYLVLLRLSINSVIREL